MTKAELDRLTDKEIIHHLTEDNQEVVKYLFYDKCRSMLGYILKEVFKYKVDIDELVSELYIMLRENDWRRVRKFEGRSRFTTWLSVVAVRFFLDKRSKMIGFDLNNSLNEWQISNTPAKCGFDDFINNIDLYNVINLLGNPRDRFVILSLDIYGYSAEETAETLNVTVGNLYNIHRRAKARLSNIFKRSNYAN